MDKINNGDFKNFGLGLDYEYRLVSQLLYDNKFANSIIDIINPNYFTDPQLKIVVASIKQAKENDDIIPDASSIRFRLLSELTTDLEKKYIISILTKIEQTSNYDAFKVQEIAMNFCKHQELKKSIKQIEKIIDSGDFERYEECESILRKALEHGDTKDDGMDVFDNIRDVLADDFRKPIRTGISGLDEIMDGGLSKGELAVILAPFGLGKTTLITKIANTAMNDGYNVLQIFFEDNPKVIQRKHISCWTGIDLNSLSFHKDQIIDFCEQKQKESKNGSGIIKLKKFPSDGTTMPMIRQYVRKKISEGFRPDIVLLDYIDVVQPSRKYDDANVGEGSVMRQFEAMLSELNIAGWTAVQGNRESIKSTVVEANQMGGSIKKGQIGHFILSIAKSLEQKETGRANMAVLKSRFGKDGIVFENIIFDNARIQIDMGENSVGLTKTEYKKELDINDQQRVNEVLANIKRKNLLNEE